MNDTLFEQLLYEEESATLDFKKEQYPFAKATDDDKSELLKDILGFVNTFRRSEAYILVGVEDVRGGRGNVVGIPAADQLPDHALQQFVNSLTNQPVRFHYQAFAFEGKQVGVIRIEEQQPKPVYLKRDFGKLKKEQVYVRRGSSTDPTKPAKPEEIAQMGRLSAPQPAELVVEFADVVGDKSLGTRLSLEAEFCEMPPRKSIGDWKEPRGRETSYGIDIQRFDPTNQTNANYYRDLAGHEFARRLFRPVRLVVRNAGQAAANSVRAELTVPASAGVVVIYQSELPDPPKRRFRIFPYASVNPIRSAFRQDPGDVTIDKNDERVRVEIECGNLQPGRRVWSDVFCIGIRESGEILLTGLVFADNLPRPKDFTLTIAAEITKTQMTGADLLQLPEPPAEPED